MENQEKLEKLEKAYEQLGKEIELLKQPQFEYPIFCKSKKSSLVVKFDGLQSGEVVVQVQNNLYPIGHTSNDWAKHTDTGIWEVLPINKETGLYHKQPVWCFDNDDTHARHLKFYDAINNSTFSWCGTLNGANYKNIEPFIGEIPEWMLTAIQTLEA